jgi:DNA primase
MPGIDYRRLRQQVSMAQVLDLLGFQATRRQGDQLRGACPIPGCSSRSGYSFSVHLTRQVYRCFACRSHGNPLDLWAAVHRLPFHAAALNLCQTISLIPPWLTDGHLRSKPNQSRHIPSRPPSPNH